MTKYLKGWLECQFNVLGWWQGIMPIEEPIDKVKVFSAKLFDVDNRTALKPIASRRGIPNDASEQAKKNWEKDKDGFSDSYATYAEVMSVAKGKLTRSLEFLTEAMTEMAHTHGEQNIRLVVWFVDKP